MLSNQRDYYSTAVIKLFFNYSLLIFLFFFLPADSSFSGSHLNHPDRQLPRCPPTNRSGQLSSPS
jgi:hypothetical protein